MIITNIILGVFPKKNYLKQKKLFILELWFSDGVKHSLGSVMGSNTPLEVCQMLFFKIFFICKYIIIIYIF